MNKRRYRGSTRPSVGDYVATYDGGELTEAWVVRDVLFEESLLSVEILSMSEKHGAIPTGMTGFVSTDNVYLMMRDETHNNLTEKENSK